jgi:hypothetical protein
MAKEDYVMNDLMGYPYNGKYPPKGDKRGIYHGYSSDKEETLYYDFAVLGYDMAFTYGGKRYYFMSDPEYVALSDEHFTQEHQRFENGNAALEKFKIDGKSIIELIDSLEDVESY